MTGARRLSRITTACLVSAALIGGAVLLPSHPGVRAGSLLTAYDASKAAAVGPDLAGVPHRHDDPATKNALSRGGEVTAATVDPTSRQEAAASAAYVARERALPDPRLTTVPVMQRRRRVPQDRYAMAGGCYTLAAPNGRYVARTAGAGLATATRRRDAEPFTFRATDLGTYLLFGTASDFVGSTGTGAPATLAAAPSPATEWTTRETRRGFVLTVGQGRHLSLTRGTVTVSARAVPFRLTRTPGCTAYPESQVNVSGRPHAGVTPYQEVRGYVDAHTHGQAWEFLGGRVHCGKPWDAYGPAYALTDCFDHTITGGKGAALEAFLSNEPTHDPVGWPTFRDWPAPNSLTHEGTYYKWMERSWRAGQRVFVNLLVENNKLCEIYPLKRNSCDDMDSLRLQAKDMYELQDYVDAQYGGPGKGWYRIVTSPWQARKVVNAGKLAVVMGIETSLPFGCTYKRLPLLGDQPACTTAQIDAGLDEMRALGVRQMELVNKFDNALSGIAGDNGATGAVVDAANFLETGSYWDMRHCEPADGESADRAQFAAPDITAGQQDALFGAVGQLFGLAGVGALPLYGPPAHCNTRGLTTLGAHLVDRLMAKHMLIDPDHMSVKARNSLLSQLEAGRYPGVLSSHSWSTPDAYPRIYELGGFVAPYAGDSTGFVEKWRRHLGWADPRYYFGFGYGADMNGLGAQGNPRGPQAADPVTYPFTGFNGVTVDRQRAGQRVYDINVDGVAQYGQYADWIEDIAQVAGPEGPALEDDMMRGAEAYLQTWERAEGIAPDPCRNPELRMGVAKFEKAARPGTPVRTLMRRVGQPWQRLGSRFTYCAGPAAQEVRMSVRISARGRVLAVRRR
ncbi:hypothetical protein [Nocardioides sp. LHG3406-4]|uniref:hypothetical protein n=1 Tax=Nocardioides sp. LHG3406-4 TaxID=2804575 RepID=UPI003CEC68BA